MKVTAAVVPARLMPFELQTLDLAGPLPDQAHHARQQASDDLAARRMPRP